MSSTRSSRPARPLALALAALTLGAAATADAQSSTVVANSQTDFSSTQGQANWSYGYWNRSADVTGVYAATDFRRFSLYDNGSNIWRASASDTPYSGVYTQLGALGGHPNGTNNGAEVWAIRRYVVQSTGVYSVSGMFGKTDVRGGTGTTAAIFVNGAQTFTRSVGGTDAPASYTDALGFLTAGTVLDFALEPRGADSFDTSEYTAVLSETPSATVTPEPSTWALLAGGLASLAGVARRRRAATA